MASAGSAKTHSDSSVPFPGSTERMLIRHLQELVADGIVKKTIRKRFRPAFTIHFPRMEGRSPSGPNDVQLGRSHLKRLSARR